MDKKEKILLSIILSGKNGISGNKLAGELGVSRNAVWKYIEMLRNEGYKIEANQGKGYVIANPDVMSEEYISYMINNKFPVYYYKSISSTNTEAKRLAETGVKEALVVAEKQSEGKGRFGRRFVTKEGSGVYMSLLLRPQIPIRNLELITACTAVYVCKVIEELYGVHAGIKWVNDIFYNNRKLCGILTESSVNMEAFNVEYIIIGIGINLLRLPEEAGMSDIAVSLEEISENTHSRAEVISALVNKFKSYESDLFNKTFLSEYKERQIVLNRKVKVIRGRDTYNVVAIDIEDDGSLTVIHEDGKKESINSGEVSLKL